MLTRALAKRAARVIAVEIDPALVEVLSRRMDSLGNVEIAQAGFRDVQPPSGKYTLVSNAPYGLTAEFLRWILESPRPPDDAYLILQRESAERFAGGPYATESLQSLLLKPWWHVEIVRRFDRRDFQPAPRVDSVLLGLARRPRPLVEEAERERDARFMRRAFGGSGPTVRDGMRGYGTPRDVASVARGLRLALPTAPSTVTFDQWLRLYRLAHRDGRLS